MKITTIINVYLETEKEREQAQEIIDVLDEHDKYLTVQLVGSVLEVTTLRGTEIGPEISLAEEVLSIVESVLKGE